MAKTQPNDWGRFQIAVPDENIRNIVGASEGLAGSGKTRFWFTAPDPIAYFQFDPGGRKGTREQIAQDFPGKEIRYIDYCPDFNIGKLPKEDRVSRAIEVLGQFQEDWDVAIRKARTLIIDREPDLWEMVRYAHDEVDSPDPKSFHELNLMLKGWIQDAETNGKNLGLIRGLKDTWGVTGISNSGKKQQGFTGILKADGNKYIPDWVQLNMRHRWDNDSREFKVQILEKCRLGNAVDLMGTEYGGMDFLTLATILYPESEPSEWGFED